ncbi:hypothetical protein [Arcticibacter tournemirensis]
MINEELKVRKIVKDPQLSLKQIAAYVSATVSAKEQILKKSKYPGGYIPRFYEMSRRIVCDAFSANLDDYSIYYDQLEREAARLKKEALAHPVEKDEYKNRVCSASGLDALRRMSMQLEGVLDNYILNSNLTNRKNALSIEGVRIGAMADILLYGNGGASQVGFLKFNFTKAPMKEAEAKATLYILRTFFEEKKGLELNGSDCILIDVFAGRIYKAVHSAHVKDSVIMACQEIKRKWDSVSLEPTE